MTRFPRWILARLTRWLLNRRIERDLSRIRIARVARQEAAARGVSTDWRRRGERCRETFARGAKGGLA